MNKANEDIANQSESGWLSYMWTGAKGAYTGAEVGFAVVTVGQLAYGFLAALGAGGGGGASLAFAGAGGGSMSFAFEVEGAIAAVSEGAISVVANGALGIGIVSLLESVASGGGGDSGGSGTTSPYSNLPDGPKVGKGKGFTKSQKDKIINQNMKKNGGVVKSDSSGEVLTKPQKSTSGVKPDPKEWQIDHIEPKSNGGSNSYSNSQVLSRAENRAKSNK